jgi:hypothetical protein
MLKKSLNPEECRKFFFEFWPTKFNGHAPIFSQDGNNIVTQNNTVEPNFVHVMPIGLKKINCRLYFNTTPENSCKFGELLLEASAKNNIPIYFKFDTEGCRNDSMLIYTNYEQVQEIVNIVKKIEKKYPKLFIGANKSGVFTAKIDDIISYGEEPQYKHSSFNSERSEAIESFIAKEKQKACKFIGNFNGKLQNSQWELLNLKEYIIYRLSSSFLDTLEQTQQNIRQGNFPRFVNQQNVQDYISIETNIYEQCKKEIPVNIMSQFQDAAEKIVKDLKQGFSPNTPHIQFATKRTSLIKNQIEAKSMKEKGFFIYNHPINLNLERKLFDVFDIQSKILNDVTEDKLQPFFDDHHCSLRKPYLNTETEQELNSVLGL